MRLHPKYGLNPTMPVCIFCGQDKGEIALLGASYDKEAPMRMAIDREPCDKCKERWSRGITLLECDDKRMPTGRHMVLTEEGARQILTEAALNEIMRKHKIARMSREMYKGIDDYINTITAPEGE